MALSRRHDQISSRIVEAVAPVCHGRLRSEADDRPLDGARDSGPEGEYPDCDDPLNEPTPHVIVNPAL